MRTSLHFSPSRGIPRDQEIFSWWGWGIVSTCYLTISLPNPTLTMRKSPHLVGFDFLYPTLSTRTSPHLVGFDLLSYIPPSPRELLLISWDLICFPISHPIHENFSWSRGIWFPITQPTKISNQYMPMLLLLGVHGTHSFKRIKFLSQCLRKYSCFNLALGYTFWMRYSRCITQKTPTYKHEQYKP